MRNWLQLVAAAIVGLLLVLVTPTSSLSEDASSQQLHRHQSADAILNRPSQFHIGPSHETGHHLGKLVNALSSPQNVSFFEAFVDAQISRTDGLTDGEVADVVEHYFWGQMFGLAMELGALDGSPKTRSMTFELENQLGWSRILIEGDPRYRQALKKQNAFSVNSAICEKHTTVHFKQADYVGGILEFMGMEFLKSYHPTVYNAGVPPGNLSSVDWSLQTGVLLVECWPLQWILHKAFVRHVNFFILDVEGGELEVLKSINWNHTRFDVLCIETDEVLRPPGYTKHVIDFMSAHGYHNNTIQQGRNIWFLRDGFVPSRRPGLSDHCFNGARKSIREDQWFSNRKTPPFEKCPKIAI